MPNSVATSQSMEKSLERNGSNVYRAGAFDNKRTREFANVSVSSQYAHVNNS